MSENLEWYYELLLVERTVNNNDLESYREHLKSSFIDFENAVLNEDHWDIFLNNGNSDFSCFLDKFDTSSTEEKIEIIKFGIGCILIFTQANFTGPNVSQKMTEFLNQEVFEQHDYKKLLNLPNATLSVHTLFPQLLFTARLVFESCIITPIINNWWKMRAIYLHQRMLDELSTGLLREIDLYKEILLNLYKREPLLDNIAITMELEICQVYMLFHEFVKATKHLNSAEDMLNITNDLIEVECHGTRNESNRYLVKIYPERIKKYSQDDPEKSFTITTDETMLPKIVPLGRYRLLATEEFRQKIAESLDLKPPKLKYFLAKVEKLMFDLTDEDVPLEVIPYLELILAQKNSFCLRIMALLHRCEITVEDKSTLSVSLQQYDEILRSFKKRLPDVQDRFQHVFSTGMRPIFKVKTRYGRLLKAMNRKQEALNYFVQMQCWEDAVQCYLAMDQVSKAVKMLNVQIRKQSTVKLLCLLGDVCKDESHYKRAWNLSKRCSHVTQRHWGIYFYGKEEYEECVPHLQKSLSINPLQPNVWILLGHAANHLEKWILAATAFRRYTAFNGTNINVWNDLGKAYVLCGNNKAAYFAIDGAARCDPHDPGVWMELIAVSYKIGFYEELIRAFYRMASLEEGYIDEVVLRGLVNDVLSDRKDSQNLPYARLVSDVRELLDKLSTTYPSEGIVWEMYGRMTINPVIKGQRLHRALKIYTRRQGWATSLSQCEIIVNLAQDLCKTLLVESIEAQAQLVLTAKTTISAVFFTVRRNQLTYQESTEIRNQVAELGNLLHELYQKIQGH